MGMLVRCTSDPLSKLLLFTKATTPGKWQTKIDPRIMLSQPCRGLFGRKDWYAVKTSGRAK